VRDNERQGDYSGGAGADCGSGWPTNAGGGAVGARLDNGARWEGGDVRGADAGDPRTLPAASQDDGRAHVASGRGGPKGRSDHGQGRRGDTPGGRQCAPEPLRDGGGYPAAGAGVAAGSPGDAYSGRHWDSEPRREGGYYPTAGAGAAAGLRSARWNARGDSDGPATALPEVGIAGPVVTPVPGQQDVAYDGWLSSLWDPPSPC